MPRTLTTQDRGNLIHTYQDGAQTALKLHGIRWHPDRYPLDLVNDQLGPLSMRSPSSNATSSKFYLEKLI